MKVMATTNGSGRILRTEGLLVIALLPMLALTGCGVVERAPAMGASALKAANPLNWFGGDKKRKGQGEKGEDGDKDGGDAASNPMLAMPGSATLGTVYMVERRNDFLLIKASRLSEVKYGTTLISQNADGHQTAELKLSPERNSQFLVADILRGDPEVGDVVKVVGVRGEDGAILPAGGDELQVLE